MSPKSSLSANANAIRDQIQQHLNPSDKMESDRNDDQIESDRFKDSRIAECRFKVCRCAYGRCCEHEECEPGHYLTSNNEDTNATEKQTVKHSIREKVKIFGLQLHINTWKIDRQAL